MKCCRYNTECKHIYIIILIIFVYRYTHDIYIYHMGSSTSAASRTCRTKPFVGFAPPLPPKKKETTSHIEPCIWLASVWFRSAYVIQTNYVYYLKKAGKLSLLISVLVDLPLLGVVCLSDSLNGKAWVHAGKYCAIGKKSVEPVGIYKGCISSMSQN